MDSILLIVHLVVAVSLVSIILLQQGKGADMGAAFGSGASQTVFGASGSGSFLTRTTAVLGTVFFALSLSLAYFSVKAGSSSDSVVDGLVPAAVIAPAGDAPMIPEELPVGDLPPE